MGHKCHIPEPGTTSEAYYLRSKRIGLLVSVPKFSFQIKVKFEFHLEIKVRQSGGRVERHITLRAHNSNRLSSGKFTMSMIRGAMSPEQPSTRRF